MVQLAASNLQFSQMLFPRCFSMNCLQQLAQYLNYRYIKIASNILELLVYKHSHYCNHTMTFNIITYLLHYHKHLHKTNSFNHRTFTDMYTIITSMSSSSVCAFRNNFVDSLVSGFVMENIFNPQQFQTLYGIKHSEV